MAIFKNTSDSNIIIEKQVVVPGDPIEIPNNIISKYQKLIDGGMISLNKLNYEEENQNIKQRLLPTFFSFYLNQDLNQQEIKDLKWFYKNVGPTSIIDNSIKSLIDDCQNVEELKEVLLNHLYPELINVYFNTSNSQ